MPKNCEILLKGLPKIFENNELIIGDYYRKEFVAGFPVKLKNYPVRMELFSRL